MKAALLIVFLRKKDIMNKICLSDEMIASYAEGLLAGNDLISVEEHLKHCVLCSEIALSQKECVLVRRKWEFTYAPASLFERLKEELETGPSVPLLEIVVSFKEKVLEAIRTTGEFLPLSSIQPAYAMRGQADAGNTVTIRETLGETTVTVEISKQNDIHFCAIIKTINAQTNLPREDLRVNLLKGLTEVESYKTINGMVVFDALKPDDYCLQIFYVDQVIGCIKMSLKNI